MSGQDERTGFRIRGRVQGVGFRFFVARVARRLGLAGGVRNDPDGSVIAEVSGGDAAPLAEFRRELERGPAGAQVTEVAQVSATGAPMDLDF